MEERVGIAQINVNGRPDLLVGPAGSPERGMPTTPQRRLNGPRRKCPPGYRWTWKGCRPARRRRVMSDVDYDKVRSIAASVRERYGNRPISEGTTLADIAAGNVDYAKITAKAKATAKKVKGKKGS